MEGKNIKRKYLERAQHKKRAAKFHQKVENTMFSPMSVELGKGMKGRGRLGEGSLSIAWQNMHD